ncbi:hypothetical protein BDR05DRAFT_945660 [Suillus weaverae]|nr:hypothetical protein BDR05DRAFT_945660 [Suillus weaverae]
MKTSMLEEWIFEPGAYRNVSHPSDRSATFIHWMFQWGTNPISPKVTIEEEEDPDQFKPLHTPLPANGKRTLERRKTKKEEIFHDCEEEPLPALLPYPDDELPPQFDTKEDVWDDTFARKVEDPATYSINNDEVLIEYAPDGSSITLFENLSFNSPLTQDGISASEI